MGPLLLPRVKASSGQPPATNGDSVRDSYESSASSMNGTGDVWSSKEQACGGKSVAATSRVTAWSPQLHSCLSFSVLLASTTAL